MPLRKIGEVKIIQHEGHFLPLLPHMEEGRGGSCLFCPPRVVVPVKHYRKVYFWITMHTLSSQGRSYRRWEDVIPKQHWHETALTRNNTDTKQHWHETTLTRNNTDTRQHWHETTLTRNNTDTKQHWHETTLTRDNTDTKQHWHETTLTRNNTDSIDFQELVPPSKSSYCVNTALEADLDWNYWTICTSQIFTTINIYYIKCLTAF